MDKYRLKEMASYKIIDNVYDANKNFIILGLCGKIGSGTSTTAKILSMDFKNLGLPGTLFIDTMYE